MPKLVAPIGRFFRGTEVLIAAGKNQAVTEAETRTEQYKNPEKFRQALVAGLLQLLDLLEKVPFFLLLLEKLENNIVFHYKMLEYWNFWVF